MDFYLWKFVETKYDYERTLMYNENAFEIVFIEYTRILFYACFVK